MLRDAGMVIVAITKIARLWGEVKAIYLFVALLMGFGCYLVEQLLGQLQFLAAKHRTAEEHNLCLGMMLAHEREQFLIALLQ